MGLLIALVLVAQCGYSTGYAASYSYAAPTYYNTVSYVPYVQAIKFVAVEPSYNDLYPSLVAGELRAARRYEAMERQADVMEKLQIALERMSGGRATAATSYRAEYAAADWPVGMPSGQGVMDMPPPPAKSPPPRPAAQVPFKATLQVPYKASPQVPYKASPQVPLKAAPQVPAKAPPFAVPQMPTKSPPDYPATQGDAESSGPFGGVAPPAAPDLPAPDLAAAPDGLAVLGQRCASCHTAGSLRGNRFPIFVAPGRSNPSLTAAQMAEMVARVEAGDMPPSGPLPPDEVESIRRYLTSSGGAVASR